MMPMLTFELLLVALALIVTAGGVVRSSGLDASADAAPAGGPYRTAVRVAVVAELPWRARLLAVGSVLMSVAVAAALGGALATLRWEGIGVAFLPAFAVSFARVYAAGVGVGALRGVATAALVLDVPLAVFATVHLALGDHHAHDELSLAAVAAAYALADAVQSLLVRAGRPR